MPINPQLKCEFRDISVPLVGGLTQAQHLIGIHPFLLSLERFSIVQVHVLVVPTPPPLFLWWWLRFSCGWVSWSLSVSIQIAGGVAAGAEGGGVAA